MTLKQALKLKNKLVKQINEEFEKINTYNSIDTENTRPYSIVECINNVGQITNELIDLKTKIHNANKPMHNKIFRLSELKSMVSKYKTVDCTEGVATDPYSRRLEKTVVKTSELSILDREILVKKLEQEIEKLQDELDVHNSTTNI